MGASLILISRVLGSKPPENILRDLLANCHAVINVLPLSSGRSGSVSGEACSGSPVYLFISLTYFVDYNPTRSLGCRIDDFCYNEENSFAVPLDRFRCCVLPERNCGRRTLNNRTHHVYYNSPTFSSGGQCDNAGNTTFRM